MLSELTHTPLRAPHRSGGVDSLMLLSQQVRRFPEVQQGQHFGETVVVDGQIKEKAHLDGGPFLCGESEGSGQLSKRMGVSRGA